MPSKIKQTKIKGSKISVSKKTAGKRSISAIAAGQSAGTSEGAIARDVVIRDVLTKDRAGNVVSRIDLGKLETAGPLVVIPTTDQDKQVISAAVRWQRQNRRSGTHSTKTRAEVTGGGKKPWKQKGTGNARSGSNTSPIWVGGGVAHGPKPRSYRVGQNKKERAKALRLSLGDKNSQERLVVLDNSIVELKKTREAVATLRACELLSLGGNNPKLLIVFPSLERTAEMFPAARAFRNIAGVKVVSLAGLNVEDVVNSSAVVFSQNAFEEFTVEKSPS